MIVAEARKAEPAGDKRKSSTDEQISFVTSCVRVVPE